MADRGGVVGLDEPRSRAQATRDEEFSSYMAARQPSLLRTAYLLTGERAGAEDLVQTAFAKLYLSWEKVRDRESLDGYVRRILVNEHNSAWRRAWKRLERSSHTVPDTAVIDQYDDGQGAALWSFVQSLPPRQRAVIVLRYYEGLSEAEIASTLAISQGTVKSQASRALAALRARAIADSGSPNPGSPNPGSPNPGGPNPGSPARTTTEEGR